MFSKYNKQNGVVLTDSQRVIKFSEIDLKVHKLAQIQTSGSSGPKKQALRMGVWSVMGIPPGSMQ